jgi:hypothetical protein
MFFITAGQKNMDYIEWIYIYLLFRNDTRFGFFNGNSGIFSSISMFIRLLFSSLTSIIFIIIY